MKKLFITTTILLLSNFLLIAQTKEKDLSKAEEFSLKAGILIEKDFIDVGKTKGIEIQVMKIKDLIAGTEINSLRFEYEYKSGSSYSSDTKVAILDADEIDGLIKSMKFIQSNIFNSTRESYTEVTFSSRTGFKAGCYWDNGKWKCYFKLEKYDSNSSVFFSNEDFAEILAYVEQGKTKM